jgi:hypothetical protein
VTAWYPASPRGVFGEIGDALARDAVSPGSVDRAEVDQRTAEIVGTYEPRETPSPVPPIVTRADQNRRCSEVGTMTDCSDLAIVPT